MRIHLRGLTFAAARCGAEQQCTRPAGQADRLVINHGEERQQSGRAGRAGGGKKSHFQPFEKQSILITRASFAGRRAVFAPNILAGGGSLPPSARTGTHGRARGGDGTRGGLRWTAAPALPPAARQNVFAVYYFRAPSAQGESTLSLPARRAARVRFPTDGRWLDGRRALDTVRVAQRERCATLASTGTGPGPPAATSAENGEHTRALRRLPSSVVTVQPCAHAAAARYTHAAAGTAGAASAV